MGKIDRREVDEGGRRDVGEWEGGKQVRVGGSRRRGGNSGSILWILLYTIDTE